MAAKWAGQSHSNFNQESASNILDESASAERFGRSQGHNLQGFPRGIGPTTTSDFRLRSPCIRNSAKSELTKERRGGALCHRCRGTESNCRHRHFQCRALPTELPRRAGLILIPAARSCQGTFAKRNCSGLSLSQKSPLTILGGCKLTGSYYYLPKPVLNAAQ